MLQTAAAVTVGSSFLGSPFSARAQTSSQPYGIALCIGLDFVDSNAFEYQGWNGALANAKNDMRSMTSIAQKGGFKEVINLTDGSDGNPIATIDRVYGHIYHAGQSVGLRAGDTFLLTFAGHGGERQDLNGDESGPNDQTFCLFDGQLVDDVLGDLWTNFAPGVQIVVVADKCHAGTPARVFEGGARVLNAPAIAGRGARSVPSLPRVAAQETAKIATPAGAAAMAKTFTDFRAELDKMEAAARTTPGTQKIGEKFNLPNPNNLPHGAPFPFRAMPRALANQLSPLVVSQGLARFRTARGKGNGARGIVNRNPARSGSMAQVLSFGACQDSENAYDGTNHGLFTDAIIQVSSSNPGASYNQAFGMVANTTEQSGTQHPKKEIFPDTPNFGDKQAFFV